MNKMKKITGITLLAMALAVPAFAWGPGMGQGVGPGFGPGPGKKCDNCPNKLTPEQQEKMDKLMKNFEDKTTDSRNEIMKKKIDLNAEINRDNPDLKKAKAIQKDINELQAEISDARLEFIIEAKKIDPDMRLGRRSLKRGSGGMRRAM